MMKKERVDVLAVQQGLFDNVDQAKRSVMAGLVLTEHHAPNTQVLDFCQSAIKNGLPILHTPLSTFTTAEQLAKLSKEMPVVYNALADQVSRFVSRHINQ